MGKTSPKVLYIGWIRRDNLGDEAIYDVFVDEMKKRIPNLEISAAQELNPNEDGDLVVLGGGDLLSVWNYGWDVEYNHFLCRGIPGVILGSGSRNFYDREGITQRSVEFFNLLRNNLDRSKYVYVRDEITQAYMRSLLQNPCKIQCAGDLALMTEVDRRTKFTKKTIAINVANTFNECFGKSDSYVSTKILQLISDLKCQYDIKLFSMYKLDNDILFNIRDNASRMMNIDLEVIPHDYYKNCKDLASFLSSCHIVISERLHGCILSACVGVPFISLAYRWKCINFALYMGMPELVIKTDEIDIDKMDLINYIERDYLSIVQNMEDKIYDTRQDLKIAFDNIASLLNK